jgi:hypothetical protein
MTKPSIRWGDSESREYTAPTCDNHPDRPATYEVGIYLWCGACYWRGPCRW